MVLKSSGNHTSRQTSRPHACFKHMGQTDALSSAGMQLQLPSDASAEEARTSLPTLTLSGFTHGLAPATTAASDCPGQHPPSEGFRDRVMTSLSLPVGGALPPSSCRFLFLPVPSSGLSAGMLVRGLSKTQHLCHQAPLFLLLPDWP